MDALHNEGPRVRRQRARRNHSHDHACPFFLQIGADAGVPNERSPITEQPNKEEATLQKREKRAWAALTAMPAMLHGVQERWFLV